MKIQIEVRNVYGNETIYPVCEMARGFAKLLKQKTLTAHDLNTIAAMGFEIEQVRTACAGWPRQAA